MDRYRWISRLLFPFLLLVLESLTLSSCRSRVQVQEPVEVKVLQVGFDQSSNSPIVILQAKSSERTMPIWIGMAEAQAIALELQGTLPLRPLTHDLVKTILEQVGVEVEKVLVSELRGSTYYARIHLINGKKALTVDSRPSDAIALALRFHRPIFVARALFESAPASGEKSRETAARTTRPHLSEKIGGMTVQNLTDILASHFDLPTSEGVLVTDVESTSGGRHLRRGDVIVAVNGKKVGDIDELRREIGQASTDVLTLVVRREGEETQATLAVPKENANKKEEDLE